MPGTPTVGISINFANGPAFGNPLLLDDPTTPLGTGILADIPADVVDVSDIALSVNIRRGKNRILNKVEAGIATVVLADNNGDFSPANTNSPYYGKLLPLRKIRIWADYDDGGGIDRTYLYSGYITTYNSTYGLGVEDTSKITLQCVDGFRLLNGIGITTVPGSGAQLSGARVNALLDVVDWPLSQRNVNDGNTTLIADSAVANRNLLDAITLVESSEFGGFFVSKEGDATFYSRDTISKKADVTPILFSDDGIDIGYQQIEFANDDTLLVNDVTVTRSGSTSPQNVFDQTSIDTYFLHSGKRDGILVQTDAEALDQARTLLVARKNTTDRIESMTINLLDSTSPSKINAGLQSELYTLINVTKTVPGGSTITKELFVQGISHDIALNKFTTKFLTAEPFIQAFILNSTTTQGKLGSGILSY